MHPDYNVKNLPAKGTRVSLKGKAYCMRFETDRMKAIQLARSRIRQGPLYLDTETTGLKEFDEIVEIAVIDQDGKVLLDTLVKPLKRIPADAVAIHGITDAMVQDALRWSEVWPKLEPILRGHQVAIYNADFDLRMMSQSHRLHMLPWRIPQWEVFCVMQLYAQFFGDWDAFRGKYRFQSLENAGRQSKIPLPNTHRARDDATLTRALLHYIASVNV